MPRELSAQASRHHLLFPDQVIPRPLLQKHKVMRQISNNPHRDEEEEKTKHHIYAFHQSLSRRLFISRNSQAMYFSQGSSITKENVASKATWNLQSQYARNDSGGWKPGYQ